MEVFFLRGYCIIRNPIKERKKPPKINNKIHIIVPNILDDFWKGVIATMIGLVLSSIPTIGLEVWKEHNQKPLPTNMMVLPPIQIVHDTLYVKEKKQ